MQLLLEKIERRYSDPATAPAPGNPLARLMALHTEAREITRLSALVGRTFPAALALAFMAGAALSLGSAEPAAGVAWTAIMLVATGAMLIVWRRALVRSVELARLKSFSQDLDTVLVFAGIAWGSGAFLALATYSSLSTVLMFSAGAGAVIALLLRARETVFPFLAPVAALTAFACVVRPLAGGAVDAALVLIACAAVAGIAALAGKLTVRRRGIANLAALPFA